jgi:Asp-tRNA(Asn)/Glu-tRNA(Gln) amidotransferase A subunit family amidase
LIRARLQAGRYITATQYLAAQRIRRELCREANQTWSQVDLLVTPTVGCPPPPLGASTAPVGSRREPVGNALVLYTAPFSVTGSPAISVPCGWTASDLPLGLQIAGPAGADAAVCFAAASFEADRDPEIAARRPPHS